MRYNKPATTVEQQVARLQARGLACDDPERAARQLLAIGYYRLSAYWSLFEKMAPDGHTRSKDFQSGASWDDVLSVYVFEPPRPLAEIDADLLEVTDRIKAMIEGLAA